MTKVKPGPYENTGVPVLFGGHNLPPLVVIGLTDLPKSCHGNPRTPRDDRPGMYTIQLNHKIEDK